MGNTSSFLDALPASDIPAERESVKALRECIELQNQKANDYQNPNSTVRQADYYPRGLESINDVVNAKMLRVKSLMEAVKYSTDAAPNFESLEDSYKDLINYASFAVAWIRNGIDGQKTNNWFNDPKAIKAVEYAKDNYSVLGND
jgi:hypothetical protein